MAPSNEPKMDELKRLLRRIDGLDASNKAGKSASTAETEQRGYVGALRGTPEVADGPAPGQANISAARSAAPAALWMAALVALISSVAAYVVITHDPEKRGASNRPAGAVEQDRSGSATTLERGSTTMQDSLIRSAEQLLKAGDVEAGRTLLQRAAELGSGNAALKLGLSYDPTHPNRTSFADSQSNPALARAWYEKAVALGTQEAAAYIRPSNAK